MRSIVIINTSILYHISFICGHAEKNILTKYSDEYLRSLSTTFLENKLIIAIIIERLSFKVRKHAF